MGATSIGEIQLDMILNSAKFQRQMNGVKSQAESMGNKMSGVFKKVGAAIVAAFSVAAIKKFGQECIESAASVQAAGSQFEQTFGDMQSQAESAMKSVADTSGIVQSRLQGVGTSIYAFAKTTGMESAQALTMMQEALQVTADSAAYYDRSLEDTAESLKSFLKGNFENDAALGLSCTETTRNTAANKLYGKSFKDLSESQKQLTLLQMVKDANKLSGAMGQASRESEGWENVTGNLKETWNQFLAVVGKPILQGAVTVIQKITSAIQKLTEYAKTAVSALSDLFGWETNESVANTNAVAKNISESTENQEELTVATAKTNEVAKRGVASFDKLNVISQSNSGDSGDSDSSTNATSSDAGLTNLSNAKLNESVDGFKQKFDKFFEPIKKSWEKYGKPVFDKFKLTINKIKTATDEWVNEINLEPLKNALDGVLEKIQPIIDMLCDDLAWAWEEVILPLCEQFIELDLPNILNLIGHLLGFITPIVKGINSVLKPVWEKLLQPLLKKSSEVLKEVVDKIGPKLEKLGEKIGGFLEKISPIVSKIAELIKPVFEILIEIVGGTIGAAIGSIIDTLSGLFTYLSGAADIIVGLFSGDWDKVGEGFKEVGDGLVQALISPFKGIWDTLVETVNPIKERTVGFFQEVWDKIKNVLAPVKEWFSGLWDKINTSFHTVFDPWVEIFNRVKTIVNDKIIQPVKEIFSDMWGKLKDGASQAWEGIKEVFTPIADWFKDKFSKAWQKVKDIFSAGGKVFDGIKDGILDGLKSVVNGLITGINKVIEVPFNGLNDVLGKIRDIEIVGVKPFYYVGEISVPQIPKLAKGGIVKAPTLAVVGDNAGANSGNPEVIAPLNKLQSMINTSNGQDIVILTQILDYLKRIYEMFVIFRNQGGNMYEFVARLNGSVLFDELVKQNELYKKRHNGKSAFA